MDGTTVHQVTVKPLVYKIPKYFCVNTGLDLFHSRNDNRTPTLECFSTLSLIEDFGHGDSFMKINCILTNLG